MEPKKYPTEKWAALAEDAGHIKDELIHLVGKRVIWMAHNESLKGLSIDDATSIVHDWLRSNYRDSMIVGLRRILDDTRGVKSLVKLLEKTSKNSHEFTFERFAALYTNDLGEFGLELATRDFSHYSKGGKQIDRKLIEADIKRLKTDFKRIIDFANKWVTHSHQNRPDPAIPLPTYDDLHKAFDDVGEVMNKYLVLLTASQSGYEPQMPFGYEKVFKRMVRGSGKKLSP